MLKQIIEKFIFLFLSRRTELISTWLKVLRSFSTAIINCIVCVKCTRDISAVCFPRSSVDHDCVISEYYICKKKHIHSQWERQNLNFSKGKLKVTTINMYVLLWSIELFTKTGRHILIRIWFNNFLKFGKISKIMVRKNSRLHWLGVGVEGGRGSGVRREVFGGLKNFTTSSQNANDTLFKKNTAG